MVDGVPPDEGYEMLDGEMDDEEWDKTNNKNVAGSDDTQNLIKWGVILKCYRGKQCRNCNMTPLKFSTQELIVFRWPSMRLSIH